MRKTENPVTWVVYRLMYGKNKGGMGAVCEQAEWDEMERIKPGYHKLILAGIANEGEAERLARSVPAEDSTSKPSEGNAAAVIA